MKKILMYVNSMNALGGIERVIANLSDKFSDYYNVTILVKDKPVSVYKLNDKVKIQSLNVELKMNMNSRMNRIVNVFVNCFKSRRALKKYLVANTFDYIYTAFPTNGLEAYLADKTYRNKIIASEHASYYAYNFVYRKIKSWLYPRLKAISVPTTMDTDIYKKLGYNAYYIPHLNTYSQTHNNELNSKRIINVGRLTSDKQQMLLLDIWKKVYDNIDDKEWKLQIIGSGEEEEHLNEKIIRDDIKNVEMIPHTFRIADYYRNAELFVFTSKMEGFGMVLLEAMSFGVPCVPFDCPSGPRDIIRNSENGYLINCYDKEEYCNCVINYINKSKDEKNLLSDCASKFIEKWDNNLIIDKWKKLLK